MLLDDYLHHLEIEQLLKDTYPATSEGPTSMPTITPIPPKQEDLKPGDVLLYRPKGIFGYLIRVKTWHRISHVEVYLGSGLSSASRDGQGVNLYPLRLSELAYVLRPKPGLQFDAIRAHDFTANHAGTPYGWADLLDFAGFHVDTKGVVCSPWAAMVLRDNGWPIFDGEPPNLIAPFQFKTSELLYIQWSDGQQD